MKRLLIAESEGFGSDTLARLNEHFAVNAADLGPEELGDHIADYELVWVRLRSFLGRQLLDRAENLQAIITNTTGLNHIDLESAHTRGIEIISLKGETEFLKEIRATAEHTIGLTLALLRQIPASHQHVQQASWNRDLFRGHEIHHKTVGLIGFGRLGSIVAKYFHAFDVELLTATKSEPGLELPNYVELVTQTELLERSDIVSLHANYTPENQRMIAANEFEKMKPAAIFVNTARGELVDEVALLDALRKRSIAGAAIDVLADEQQGSRTFQALVDYANRCSNLVMTPHIGGNTYESFEKTERFIADRLIERFSG